jgi:hypothetical protein
MAATESLASEIPATSPVHPVEQGLPDVVVEEPRAPEVMTAPLPAVCVPEVSDQEGTEVVEESVQVVEVPAPSPFVATPVELPEGMVMVETSPGRSQIAVAPEAEPERRRPPRSRPPEAPAEDVSLVQIETRK